MYVESNSRLVVFDDWHPVTGIKDIRARAVELYNIHLVVMWPIPYFDEKNREDFYLLANHICRKNKLPVVRDIEEFLMGISKIHTLKYVEFDKNQGIVWFGVLNNETGEMSKWMLDILEMEYRCPVDLVIKTGVSEYRITLGSQDDDDKTLDTVQARVTEKIGAYRADEVLLWREEYVSD